MKKLLWVSLMILLTCGTAFSQDDESGGGSGPSSGELFFEITASPFDRDGGGALLNFGQFRARYYLNETLVPRLGIFYSVDNNQVDFSPTPDVVLSITDYAFTPGIEYHFLNEGGFTSYAALDVIITGRIASRESNTSEEVIGSTQVPNGPNFAFSNSNRGFFGYGGYAAVGAEYHFASRFYFGAEIGFYVIAGRSTDVEVDGTLYQEGINFFDSGVRTSNSFRVGFKLF
jgi:hypothetical protein